jgi:hypothetical protein
MAFAQGCEWWAPGNELPGLLRYHAHSCTKVCQKNQQQTAARVQRTPHAIESDGVATIHPLASTLRRFLCWSVVSMAVWRGFQTQKGRRMQRGSQ